MESEEVALHRPAGLGRPAGAAESRLNDLRLPRPKLANRRNYCYVNSTAQALYWMGELSARPDDAYGGALLGFSILNRSSSYDLTSLVWRMLLQHWPHPLQQHDSGEFHRHVLTFLQPPAYDGEWQARLSNPCQIIDSGRLTTPILVHPTGNTLAPSMEICYQATSYLSRISRAPEQPVPALLAEEPSLTQLTFASAMCSCCSCFCVAIAPLFCEMSICSALLHRRSSFA